MPAVIRLPRWWSKLLIEGAMLTSIQSPVSATVTVAFSSGTSRFQKRGTSKSPVDIDAGWNWPMLRIVAASFASRGWMLVLQHIRAGPP